MSYQISTYIFNNSNEVEESTLNSPGAKELIKERVEIERAKPEFPIEFNHLWQQNAAYFVGIDKLEVYEVYFELLGFICGPQSVFKSHSITLTSDSSIHASIRTNEFKLFIEAFFESGTHGSSEVVLNIFKEKECILAFGGSLQSIFDKIGQHFFLNERNTSRLFQLELSGSAFTKSPVSNYKNQPGLIPLYADQDSF